MAWTQIQSPPLSPIKETSLEKS
uniref:Uncharacterized protein n=1 Tax=Arundo donax TaxID=35708 RepID=A0A0A9CQM7_ARUDO